MFTTLFLALAATSLRPVPVWMGRSTRYDSTTYCNTAVVKPGGAVPVRSGPERSFALVERLRPGTIIFTCDEATDRKLGLSRYWTGIAYAGPGKPCPGAAQMGLALHLVRRCQTGWIERRSIDTLTG